MLAKEPGVQLASKEVVEATLSLGQLALQFGRVERALLHEDGVTKESGTDHTVMLGWIGCAFADRFIPNLDIGLVAQLALVHDMVEVYAGDAISFQITKSQKNDKQEREAAAFARMKKEFDPVYPWIARVIVLYQDLSVPEARYIKTLDKIMPKVVQTLTNCDVYKSWDNTKEDLANELAKQRQVYLESFAHDQPEAFSLWDAVTSAMLATY